MILRYTIHKAICDFYGVELIYIFQDVKSMSVVEKRQLFHYLCHKHTNYSLKEIGGYCGDNMFCHATVLNSIKRIKDLISVSKKLKQEVEQIELSINLKSNNHTVN